MNNSNSVPLQEVDKVVSSLVGLRDFPGPPGEFWPAYLQGAARLTRARRCWLMLRQGAAEEWRISCQWSDDSAKVLHEVEISRLHELSMRAVLGATIHERLQSADPDKALLLAFRLDLEEKNRDTILVFLLDAVPPEQVAASFMLLKMVAHVPLAFQTRRLLHQARQDTERLAGVLDLLVLLESSKNSTEAMMTLVNELASRHHCFRVAIGWSSGDYVQVVAMSHTERIDSRTDAIQALESVMEEALDQDEIVRFPRPEASAIIARAHEVFAKQFGSGAMVSLPLRSEGGPIGVLTFERREGEFGDLEIDGLHLVCDLVARRLRSLREAERGLAARMGAHIALGLSRILGVDDTLRKFTVLLLSLALTYSFLGRWEYRVEGPFTLKTDDVHHVPAPFEGFIREVLVEVGDVVTKDQTLVHLDTTDLRLSESETLAELSRFSREIDKSKARGELADLKIAEAQRDQSQARLDRIRYQIQHAEISAPMSGLIVEGDLKERLGSPTRKGEVLLKIAKAENFFAEIRVDEGDICDVHPEAEGQLTFVSRPDLEFSLRVAEIDPRAMPDEGGAVFRVRGAPSTPAESWWRPGMTGLAKIRSGSRSPMWIFLHRTIDSVRMRLWW